MTPKSKNIGLLTLMLLSAGFAVALRTDSRTATPRQALNLNVMVPRAFGEWKELSNVSTQIVNPQQTDMLEKLYSETLTRTYVDKQGYQIMLSIAHGKGQKDGIELHKPDVCYPAQGFEITKREKQLLKIDSVRHAVQVTQLLTDNRSRKEPLIYWTLIGSKMFYSRIEKKYIEIKHAFNNEIPDGMLVRVSSIDSNEARALQMQIKFTNAWFEASATAASFRFFGYEANE